jgi:hypothetical protein
MLKLIDLMENSDSTIISFKILVDTVFLKQLSDKEFEQTNYKAKKGEVYDGKVVLKRNNNYYIDVGWDGILFCDLFIPIETNGIVNIKLME